MHDMGAGAYRGQKGVSSLLELELQVIANPLILETEYRDSERAVSVNC